jgi:ketosteroid isomerase-like protein
MEPAEVVRTLWERIEARDWAGFGALLAEDVRLEYPHSGERFRGRDNVVAINAEYPEGWSIRVLRIVAAGDTVVSEVSVPQDGVDHRAATFWTVRDGLVTDAVEYWIAAGGEAPPDWRAPYRVSPPAG